MTVGMHWPLIPVEPLERYVAARVVIRGSLDNDGCRDGLTSLWPHGSWQYRAYERARLARVLTMVAADRLACDLGQHPALIWPDWYRIAVPGNVKYDDD